MSKLKIGLTLLFSALGVFGVNEYYKPRNVRDLLKWQGVQLSSDSKVWESMFFEYETELKGKNINSDTELWKWCEERFNSSNLGDTGIVEEARKYCSDSATSIMGRIIREGEKDKLIKEGDDTAFAINYLLASNKEEVDRMIDVGEEEKEDFKKAGEKVAKWCEDHKRDKVLENKDLDNFSNFKKRCYDLKVKTFADLLEKQGRKIMKENTQFEKRFEEKMHRASGLIKELNGILANKKAEYQSLMNQTREYRGISLDNLDLSTNKALLKEYGPKLYKSYCDSKWNTDLLVATNKDLSQYAEISSRCTE